MEGQAPLYAAIVAVLYIVAEILKAKLQRWRDEKAEQDRAAREKEAAEKVAEEVKAVKTALVEKDTKIAGALGEIHLAVNSNLEKVTTELKVVKEQNKVANEQNASLHAMIAQLMKVIAPIAKNGAEPAFPPVTDAAVKKIVEAVEARAVTPPAPAPSAPKPTAAETDKLTIEAHEAAKIVITKDTKP